MGIKVLVAFSNLLFSEGVSRLLQDDTAFDVAIIKPNRLCPRESLNAVDVVLTDLSTLNRSLTEPPDSKKTGVILFETCYGEDHLVSAVISKKVRGVLLPRTEAHLLKQAVKAVARGDVWLDGSTVKDLLHGIKAKNPSPLTAREKEIADLAGNGLRNREIAEKLRISELTVKAHLHRIFKKLHIRSRSGLISRSIDRLRRGTATK